MGKVLARDNVKNWEWWSGLVIPALWRWRKTQTHPWSTLASHFCYLAKFKDNRDCLTQKVEDTEEGDLEVVL